jgi:hypothetical protein
MPRVMLLVGTKKAGFIYTSDEKREKWEVSDPVLPGWTFNHLSADLRDSTPRLYAAANHWAWGPSVAKSTDLGKTWDYNSTNLKFPPDMKSPSISPMGEWNNAAQGAIGSVWEAVPGHASEPGVVFAATQPAGLFRSEDWGVSWEPVESLNRHENRKYWSGTGGGDSCVHSVQVDERDAKLMYACVSSGGSYISRDGGKTWDLIAYNVVPTNEAGLKLTQELVQMFPDFVTPGRDPAALDEFHLMRIDRKKPDRLWGQAHFGVFRSDDRGETWEDVTEGLPSSSRRWTTARTTSASPRVS